MKDEEIKEIDTWLEDLSKKSISRILIVTNVLQSISELTGTTLFYAPYDALEKAGLDKTSIVAILTELWRKGVIDLMDYTEGSSVTGWNKNFEPDNFFNDLTMIKLNPASFGYLCQTLIKGKKIVTFPEGRNFIYENRELHIRLQDGSACTLDLSKSPILRPVFESFFYLYKEGTTSLFDRDELLKKYKECTGDDIDWKTFIKRKSSILGKMINQKEGLKNRIIWEYDKKNSKYKFEILAPSDN